VFNQYHSKQGKPKGACWQKFLPTLYFKAYRQHLLMGIHPNLLLLQRFSLLKSPQDG
jgi:hypothetical protein